MKLFYDIKLKPEGKFGEVLKLYYKSVEILFWRHENFGEGMKFLLEEVIRKPQFWDKKAASLIRRQNRKKK